MELPRVELYVDNCMIDGETLAFKVGGSFQEASSWPSRCVVCIPATPSCQLSSWRSLDCFWIPWCSDIWVHVFSLLFLLVQKVSSSVTLHMSTKMARCTGTVPLKTAQVFGWASPRGPAFLLHRDLAVCFHLQLAAQSSCCLPQVIQ